ncbi:hypothetical protein [Paenibacillus hunanensis]|nr:hypothetical protein [Paenibacillus hunanensis]
MNNKKNKHLYAQADADRLDTQAHQQCLCFKKSIHYPADAG